MRGVRYWEHLRRWRIHAGYSLEAAASAVERSKQWLSQVERGSLPIHMGHFLALLELYGVRWDDFFIQDDGRPDPRLALVLDAKALEKVRERLLTLPPADVRILAVVADTLADRGKNRKRRNRSAERLLAKR